MLCTDCKRLRHKQTPARDANGIPCGGILLRSIAGLTQQVEHILLIELDAGLVERVHAQHIGGDAARQLEEVEQLAERIGIDLVGLQHDVRHAAVDVGAERALEGLLLDKVERLALEVVQAVQILPVDLDGRA